MNSKLTLAAKLASGLRIVNERSQFVLRRQLCLYNISTWLLGLAKNLVVVFCDTQSKVHSLEVHDDEPSLTKQ